MAYRIPTSQTSPTAVRQFIDGMASGEERVTKVPADDKSKIQAFRSSLNYLAKGQYLTNSEKGDGWLWVLKL